MDLIFFNFLNGLGIEKVERGLDKGRFAFFRASADVFPANLVCAEMKWNVTNQDSLLYCDKSASGYPWSAKSDIYLNTDIKVERKDGRKTKKNLKNIKNRICSHPPMTEDGEKSPAVWRGVHRDFGQFLLDPFGRGRQGLGAQLGRICPVLVPLVGRG